jgi:hypothetical protein
MKKKKDKKVLPDSGEEKSKLSRHERDQLRLWMKATPYERLSWLEEALHLAARPK